MPRIRKKTSKRGTIRQRERIKHKISQHHKKVKKQARKDKAAGKPVQKKSKKDPGIPNSFPYKDQILAEVAEHRRQVAEERQRRKEEKKRVATIGDDGDDREKSPPEEVEMDDNDVQGFNGIMSLRPVPMSTHEDSKDVKERTPAVPVFPGPLTLREVVQKADVVLHVVDARDPLAGMSCVLTGAVHDKLIVLVNKADMVPREALAQWLAHLQTLYTVLSFRASSAFMPSRVPFEQRNKKAKAMPADDALGLADLWTCLDQCAQTRGSEELIVAVTGVANAGKSAVINSICGSDVFSIYDVHAAASVKGPSTTVNAQEVVATMPGNDARRVRFIDTPGLQFSGTETPTDEAMRARDILLRCRGRIDRLKDPMFGVTHIVTRADRHDLMLAYDLPTFLHGDVPGFLAGLARVSGLVKKRGLLDHTGAARMVLRDWYTGKLRWYTTPKRRMSAGEGVQLAAGESDARDIAWDVTWD